VVRKRELEGFIPWTCGREPIDSLCGSTILYNLHIWLG
jgi:hypothetical protein